MSRGMRSLILGLVAIAVAGVALGALTRYRAPRPHADVQVIARGEEVNLAAHLVPGKYTVFDFYAVWCAPCRALSPALERLGASHSDLLAVRKVDIIDWTMPVVAQHGIVSLPHLVLYDPAGQRAAEGEAVLDALEELFGEDGRAVSEGAVFERLPGLPVPGEDDSHILM